MLRSSIRTGEPGVFRVEGLGKWAVFAAAPVGILVVTPLDKSPCPSSNVVRGFLIICIS